MTSNNKPVQFEYWTDIDRRVGSYLVRFRWDDANEKSGLPYWIDFEVHEIISNVDEAEPTVYGFVKWDGCTQIYFPETPAIHADGQGDLEALFDCLLKVRINALEQMKTLEEYL